MAASNDLQAGVATQRDQYGRLRAPVFINGKGPFNLIVDTGANGSAVTAAVAEALGLSPDQASQVILHGVTGSARVAAIRVDSLSLGTLTTPAATLPIVADALDGADGFLGTAALDVERVAIDFRRHQVTILNAHAAAGAGFVSVPADLSLSRLISVDARVNGVPVKAIIDTGAGGTIGNSAMRDILVGATRSASRDHIIGATSNGGTGQTYSMPPIMLGDLRIIGAKVSFGDMSIFDHFHLSRQPALLIGMDVLERFESMIIDYRAHRLQFRTVTRIAGAP